MMAVTVTVAGYEQSHNFSIRVFVFKPLALHFHILLFVLQLKIALRCVIAKYL